MSTLQLSKQTKKAGRTKQLVTWTSSSKVASPKPAIKQIGFEIQNVLDRPWIQDNSGIYTLINRIPIDHNIKYAGQPIGIQLVRLDIMTTKDIPMVSFLGSPVAVRKAFVDWAYQHIGSMLPECVVSPEHFSYIGFELARAAQDENYIQD